MAYPLNRALIACSVSALALAIVTLYYWQLRKRRKSSDASESDAPNLSSLADHIANDIIHDDCTDSSRLESSSSPLVDCTHEESGLINGAVSAEKAVSLEATPSTLKTECADLIAPVADSQSGSLDNIVDIVEENNQVPTESASTESFLEPTERIKQSELDSQPTVCSVDYTGTDSTLLAPQPQTQQLKETCADPEPHSATENSLEDDTMHMKSSDSSQTSPIASLTNDCDDSVNLVDKMKHCLSTSEEETAPPNHLKVSSIDFESDSSKSAVNSIITIEAVQSGSAKVDAGQADATDMRKQSSSDETDKGNCESMLHQETTDDCTSADNGPIINSNEIENNSSSKSNDNITVADNVAESSAPAASEVADKQSSQSTYPQTSPAAVASRKPEAKSNSVKLSQTFAQVLSSKNNTTKQTPAKTMTESNGSKLPPSASLNTVPAPTLSYASVAQEKEESDAYPNFPDAATTTSQVSLSEGQCSPNSEFGECSDVHSLGSSDSGKGSSELLHANSATTSAGDQVTSSSPYHTANPPDDQLICYQFELPQYLCGKLIGAGGHFINQIKQRSGTSVVVNAHYFNSENKICSITGTKSSVTNALSMIRKRFPYKEYPNVILRQVNINPIPTIPLSQACQLHLPPDIVTDVILSCTISAGHFFLQQPTHPSYPQLNQLDHIMKIHYSEGNAPQMPQVYPGIVCAAPTEEGWYRALIKTVHESNAECDIMFVDYGGYAYNVPVSTLRQIRYDFLSLPFQASECYLANVLPVDAEKDWTPEANNLFVELAQGQIIYAAIIGYAENGIPFVNLFKLQDSNRIFINQELVENKHGIWVESEPILPSNVS